MKKNNKDKKNEGRTTNGIWKNKKKNNTNLEDGDQEGQEPVGGRNEREIKREEEGDVKMKRGWENQQACLLSTNDNPVFLMHENIHYIAHVWR